MQRGWVSLILAYPFALMRLVIFRRKLKSFLHKKSHHPSLFTYILRLRRPRLLVLPLQLRQRDSPLRRIRVRAPRVNRVQANIQDVPATEAA